MCYSQRNLRMGDPLGSTEHLDQQVVTEFGHMFDG